MTEPSPPRILILESDETISRHVQTLLAKEGWSVQCEMVSKQALQQLEDSKTAPFNLFISSFKLPRMEGDDILKNAKIISPMTQRMLMVPDNEADMVIRAINKGGINSCIVYPFTDEDLINQAKSCLVQFRMAMKRRQLKRVTAHQNKQMFQIAQKLKKKAQAVKDLIDEKKAEKLMLRSNLRKALKDNGPSGQYTLGDRMDKNKVLATPEAFQSQFIMLCNYIKAVFDNAASKIGIDPVVMDLDGLVPLGTPTPGQTEDTAAHADFIPKILKTAFSSPMESCLNLFQEEKETRESDLPLSAQITVSVSKDQTKAYLQRTKGIESDDPVTLSNLLELLREQYITHGIIEDEAIEAWIAVLKTGKEDLVVARGEAPVPGKDGKITYHFENDFTNPGKVMEDGTIDFRDRGRIPYVGKGDLIAEKIPAIESKNGTTVFGDPIPVEEVMDPLFINGSGTRISEDGLSIYADLDGQPHLDAMGNITVNPELTIKGDVDFETGNIEFKGNIVVTGIIKEGFTVKCINLTAKEIEGAKIDLSGDLNVSAGITDATITAQGTVYAKFINHSMVKGFGNLVIQKEIIDSNIFISGACQNPTGHIISSKINAKSGVEAGKIGTQASKPATLRVGTDDHIEEVVREVDASLQKSLSRLQELREKIKSIETQDQELYERITQKAQIQEKAQNEIKEITKTLSDLKKADPAEGQRAASRIKKLTEIAEAAELQLNEIFETQDQFAKQIDQLKEQVTLIEARNKTYVLQKKGLRVFADKTTALPRVVVQGKIVQDTVIQGPNASLVLRDDRSRCQIQETARQEDGLHLYEMSVADL
ncbi:MAG: DUF342 domain-containing protein [Proteobacteria bacterium]|nr:DUF342 domain-containing protein [Pseudomonadota bacterium]